MSNDHKSNEEQAVVLNCTSLLLRMLNNNNQIQCVHVHRQRIIQMQRKYTYKDFSTDWDFKDTDVRLFCD